MNIQIHITDKGYTIEVTKDNGKLLHFQKNEYKGKGETVRTESKGEFSDYEIECAVDNIDSACNDIMYELMNQDEEEDCE